jgi:hypothetical protein
MALLLKLLQVYPLSFYGRKIENYIVWTYQHVVIISSFNNKAVSLALQNFSPESYARHLGRVLDPHDPEGYPSREECHGFRYGIMSFNSMCDFWTTVSDTLEGNINEIIKFVSIAATKAEAQKQEEQGKEKDQAPVTGKELMVYQPRARKLGTIRKMWEWVKRNLRDIADTFMYILTAILVWALLRGLLTVYQILPAVAVAFGNCIQLVFAIAAAWISRFWNDLPRLLEATGPCVRDIPSALSRLIVTAAIFAVLC